MTKKQAKPAKFEPSAVPAADIRGLDFTGLDLPDITQARLTFPEISWVAMQKKWGHSDRRRKEK